MIDRRESDLAFTQKGFPLGMITDGDYFDMPEGSVELLTNMDYDVERGEVITRNGSKIAEIISGFTIPTGYKFMPDGVRLFSFNDPVDRQVALVFVRNNAGKVRIFTNTWFNPPKDNTDPVGGNNDYENNINNDTFYPSNSWINEWIEITEWQSLGTMQLVDKWNLTCGTAPNNNKINYYSGWFIWNATKWTTAPDTNLRRNECFVCVESNNGNSFQIQHRPNLDLQIMGWANFDKIYLMRYPIMVHKANPADAVNVDLTLSFDTVKLIKSNIDVKCLIGQEGGLWFGFLNKDTTKLSSGTVEYSKKNKHKYYGWWLDYETPPVPTDTTFLYWNGGVDYKYVFNAIYGLGLNVHWGNVGSADHRIPMVAFELTLDGRQHLALAKGIDHVLVGTTYAPAFTLTVYHAYSRRITSLLPFALYAEIGNVLAFEDDPLRAREYGWGVLWTTNANITIYSIFYDYANSLYTQTVLDLGDEASERFEANIGYNPREKIWLASTFGVFTQGRMFVNDLDNPDIIRYSLFNREDIFALQNQRNIDAVDKDINTGIELLGANPVVCKNNSWHIIGIEGQPEPNWRLLDVRGRVGCPYPRSICRTPYGLMFANDFGIWLLSDTGEPLNIIRGRRLQDYLALADKSVIYSEWYADHNEAWFFVGGITFWLCKLSSEEKQIGWKTYELGDSARPNEVIDVIVDENGDFYFVRETALWRYLNDDEATTGKDADNTSIAFAIREHLNKLQTSNDKFHWIESIIRYETAGFGGRSQAVTIKMYNEQNTVIKTKTVNLISAGNIIMRNGDSNSQRGIKLEVSGTLSGAGRLKIQEFNSRIKSLPRPIKSSFAKVG